MGFLKALGKMIQGKPVFEASDQTVHEPPVLDTARPAATVEPPVTKAPPPVNHQEKVIPRVSITHCKSHLRDTEMTVTAWLTNTSHAEIELDKAVLIDATAEIDRRLMPQQAHEVTLYKGSAPTTDQAHKACIYVKCLPTGDYFCADFTVEYNRESNGVYTVENLHPEHYGRPENYGVREIT